MRFPICFGFLFYLLLSSLPVSDAWAQENRRPLRVLTTKDGLPQSFVSGLVQDADGFVWLGTRNGLARYDGRQFVTFHHNQRDSATLSSDVLISLLKDQQGYIWIEHESGAIDRLTPRTQQIERLNRWALFARLPTQFTRRGWVVDGAGRLWGTQLAHGIWCYDWAQQVRRQYTRQQHGLPSDTIRGLLVSRRGGLWLLSRQHLSWFDPATGRIRQERLPVSIDPAAISDLAEGVVGLHERSNGEVMWTHRQQVFVYSPQTRQFRQFPLPPFQGASLCWFYTGPDQQDYLATYNWIYRYDAGRGLLAVGQLEQPSQSSESFLIDRSGLIWLGTNAAGVQQIDRSGPYFSAKPNQLGFQADVLGQQLGVSFANAFNWPASDTDFRLASYSVRSAYDARHQLWLALHNRVCRYDSAQRRLIQLPLAPVRTSATDRSKGIVGLRFVAGDTLWIADNEGALAWFDTGRGQWTTWMTASDFRRATNLPVNVQDMVIDQRAIWLTTSVHGLIRIDRQTRQVRVLTQQLRPTPFPSALLLGQQPDPTRASLLWIGSYDGLICLNKNTLQSRLFTTANGLPDNTIYSILPDAAGFLWLSTNRGLCRFHPRTYQTRAFGTTDRLPGDEFNRFHHLRLPNSLFAFGGPDGWVLFNPMLVQQDPFQPPVALTELKVNNQLLPPTPGRGILPVPITALSELVVPYAQNTISLSFAGLQFNQPAKLRYRYQLDGYDDAWVQAGSSPLATYTQLPPGRYTLRVNATNTTGQWSRHVRTLTITVQPPWWRTWWAYCLYALATLGLVQQYIQFRTGQERKKQEQRAQQREADQLRAIDEVKTRFFANITHEFRTPLTLLMGATDQILTQTNQPAVAQNIRRIQQQAHQLLGLTNELLELARLEAGGSQLVEDWGEPGRFLEELIAGFAPEAARRSIGLTVQVADDARASYWFDAARLERIVTNLVANALDFTQRGGQITVSLTNEPPTASHETTGGLTLRVADTGVGMTPDQAARVFDRYYQAGNYSAPAPDGSLPPATDGVPLRVGRTGTGIGLSLVRELVELQQGTITVSSQPGRGTVFTVWLPYRPATLPPVAAPADSLPPDTPLAADGRPLILLVEDNDDLARFLTDALQADYQVRRAADGVDGLAQASELIPDLVVSDVMMPRMDGYALCHQLKTNPQTDHIPVLLLTAKVDAAHRLKGLRQGADDYLSKPFQLPELQLQLHNLLATQRRLRDRLRAELTAVLSPAPDAPATEPPPVAALPNPFLESLYRVIDDHLDQTSFTVDDLAREAGLSRMQLHRKLKTLTGFTTSEFIRHYRLQQAVMLLRQGMPVAQVGYAVGFDSPSYFGQQFREKFGQTPSTFLPKMG